MYIYVSRWVENDHLLCCPELSPQMVGTTPDVPLASITSPSGVCYRDRKGVEADSLVGVGTAPGAQDVEGLEIQAEEAHVCQKQDKGLSTVNGYWFN